MIFIKCFANCNYYDPDEESCYYGELVKMLPDDWCPAWEEDAADD